MRRLEPGEADPAQFLPAAYRSVEELEGFLEHLVREVHDDPLRAAVERAVLSEPVASEFRRAPCTRGGHHAYLGGLLEHTVSVATLVGELCVLHPRLDSDLLMAAAIVHDVGKTREFTYGAEFGISDEGRQLGHLAIGAEIVGAAATGLDPERRLSAARLPARPPRPRLGAARTRPGVGRQGAADSRPPRRWRSIASTPSTRRSRARWSTVTSQPPAQ